MHEPNLYEPYAMDISDQMLLALHAPVRNALLNTSRADAVQAAQLLAGEPHTLADLYLNLLAPVMRRIGDDYVQGSVPSGGVHAAASALTMVLDLLYAERLATRTHPLPPVIVSPVQGNALSLGARILADLLDEQGFQVVYLDAPSERAAVVSAALTLRPAVVTLSVGLASQIGELFTTVKTLRRGGYRGIIAAGGQGLLTERSLGLNHGIDWIGNDPLCYITWLRARLGVTAQDTIRAPEVA